LKNRTENSKLLNGSDRARIIEAATGPSAVGGRFQTKKTEILATPPCYSFGGITVDMLATRARMRNQATAIRVRAHPHLGTIHIDHFHGLAAFTGQERVHVITFWAEIGRESIRWHFRHTDTAERLLACRNTALTSVGTNPRHVAKAQTPRTSFDCGLCSHIIGTEFGRDDVLFLHTHSCGLTPQREIPYRATYFFCLS